MSVGRTSKYATDSSSWNDKSARFQMGQNAKILSPRVYNMVIGLVIFYGLIMNYFICSVFQQQALEISWPALLIGYFVSCIAGAIIVNRSRNPLISFLGYNLVVVPIGIVISRILIAYDMGTILTAILVTTIITGLMLIIATLFPSCFLRLGRVLFIALICLIVARFIITFIFRQYNVAIINYIGAGIFSLYLGYDWQRANAYIRTLDNAVDSACDIYLDIINLFLQLLAIFGNRRD